MVKSCKLSPCYAVYHHVVSSQACSFFATQYIPYMLPLEKDYQVNFLLVKVSWNIPPIFNTGRQQSTDYHTLTTSSLIPALFHHQLSRPPPSIHRPKSQPSPQPLPSPPLPPQMSYRYRGQNRGYCLIMTYYHTCGHDYDLPEHCRDHLGTTKVCEPVWRDEEFVGRNCDDCLVRFRERYNEWARNARPYEGRL